MKQGSFELRDMWPASPFSKSEGLQTEPANNKDLPVPDAIYCMLYYNISLWIIQQKSESIKTTMNRRQKAYSSESDSDNEQQQQTTMNIKAKSHLRKRRKPFFPKLMVFMRKHFPKTRLGFAVLFCVLCLLTTFAIMLGMGGKSSSSSSSSRSSRRSRTPPQKGGHTLRERTAEHNARSMEFAKSRTDYQTPKGNQQHHNQHARRKQRREPFDIEAAQAKIAQKHNKKKKTKQVPVKKEESPSNDDDETRQAAPPIKKQFPEQKPRMVQFDETLAYKTLPLFTSIDYESDDEREVEPMTEAGPSRLKGPDDPRSGPNCEYIADWQASHRPSCNGFHEVDLGDLHEDPEEGSGIRLVNNGGFRDVWMIREFDGSRRAMKTLRYTKKRFFDLRNFDRHRRDALAFEQLSSSPYVVDIYGHCANSALFDYCSGGDLYEIHNQNRTKPDLLRVALEIVTSVAHAHNFVDGKPTIAHTDIKPDQWIMLDGRYMLNDFNRARFLAWDSVLNETCKFEVGKNGGIVSLLLFVPLSAVTVFA